MEDPYWVYEDKIRRRATMHRASCSYCNDGKGFHHMVSGRVGGEWNGPFFGLAEATGFAEGLELPVRQGGDLVRGR